MRKRITPPSDIDPVFNQTPEYLSWLRSMESDNQMWVIYLARCWVEVSIVPLSRIRVRLLSVSWAASRKISCVVYAVHNLNLAHYMLYNIVEKCYRNRRCLPKSPCTYFVYPVVRLKHSTKTCREYFFIVAKQRNHQGKWTEFFLVKLFNQPIWSILC